MPNGWARRANSNDDRYWDWLPYGFAQPGMVPTRWILRNDNPLDPGIMFLRGVIPSTFLTTGDPIVGCNQKYEEGLGLTYWFVQLNVSVYEQPIAWVGHPLGINVSFSVVIDHALINGWGGGVVLLDPDPYTPINIPIFKVTGTGSNWLSPLEVIPAQWYLPPGRQ